jgi:hypothetical protein
MTHWSKNFRRPRRFSELARAHDYGRDWYRESGANLASYAESIGQPVNRVADVVAILSPRVTVARNIQYARAYLEHGKLDGVMLQRQRALAEYENTGRFGGNKVNAFSKALQGDANAVVIDAWILRLWGIKAISTDLQYRRLATRLRLVASALHWPAAEAQAALWCGTRSLCGFTDTYSPLTFGD